MPTSFCLFALLVGAANRCADEPSASVPQNQTVALTKCPAFAGYLAEVEVSMGGITRYGRIIVTRDGCVHLEHLDEHTVRWVHGVIRQKSSTLMGWDDRPLRIGPVRRVWGRLGQNDVLVEIHTPDASIKVFRHQLLSAR